MFLPSVNKVTWLVDISHEVITLGKCFFDVCLPLRSFPPLVDWRKSDSPVDGEP